jgi:hypothetical protein
MYSCALLLKFIIKGIGFFMAYFDWVFEQPINTSKMDKTTQEKQRSDFDPNRVEVKPEKTQETMPVVSIRQHLLHFRSSKCTKQARTRKGTKMDG